MNLGILVRSTLRRDPPFFKREDTLTSLTEGIRRTFRGEQQQFGGRIFWPDNREGPPRQHRIKLRVVDFRD